MKLIILILANLSTSQFSEDCPVENPDFRVCEERIRQHLSLYFSYEVIKGYLKCLVPAMYVYYRSYMIFDILVKTGT